MGPSRRAQARSTVTGPKSPSGSSAPRGNVRADVCYRKLLGLGYEGFERTVRRAVAGAKREYRKAAGRRV